MSRQRLRPSFLEMNSSMCTHCSGKGIVRADESNAMLILRTIENEIHNGNFRAVNVYGIASSILYLLNNKRTEVASIEKKYSIKLNFFIDRDATSDSYSIEKIRMTDKKTSTHALAGPALQDTSTIYNEAEAEITVNPQKRKIEKKHKKYNENKAPEKVKNDAAASVANTSVATSDIKPNNQSVDDATPEPKKTTNNKKRSSRKKAPKRPTASAPSSN